MIASRHLMACGLISVLAFSTIATAQQYPRIGYVYPAGGQQGTTFLVTVGGQFLGSWKGEYYIDVSKMHFSGGGITAEVVKDDEPMREKTPTRCGRRHSNSGRTSRTPRLARKSPGSSGR